MNEILSKKIKLARIEAGFTQQEMAEKLGKSAQTVISWENGTFSPRAKMLEEIARITKKPLSFFKADNQTIQQVNGNSNSVSQNVNQGQDNDDIRKDIEIIKLKLDLILERLKKE